MQIDDQTRTNLNRAFVSVLRGSQVAASINLQRASLALFTIIEHTADGEPIDLGALLFYFTHEAKIPEGPATELCVVLKSREARFPGLRFALPASCAALSEEQLASIVDTYNARGGDKAATYDRKQAEPLPGTVVPMADPRRPGVRSFPLSRNQVLYGLLFLVVAGGIANAAFLSKELKSDDVPITFPSDPAGLPCEAGGPPMSKGFARCVVPRALYQKEGEAGLRARGDITLRAARTLGVKEIYVVTKEDQKVRAKIP